MSAGLAGVSPRPAPASGAPVQHVHAGLWWPAADEGKLMAAAQAWRGLASDLNRIEAAASGAVRSVRAQNQGQGIDAFAAYWGSRWAGGAGSFQQVSQAALAMADALEKYANAVKDAKRKIEELIAAAATAVVIGVALTFLTVGISDVAAEGIAAGMVAAAASVGYTLTEEVAAILTGALFATSFGALDGGLTDLAIQGERIVYFHDQQSISWSEVGINTGIGAGTGAVIVGVGAGVEAASPALRRIATRLSGNESGSPEEETSKAESEGARLYRSGSTGSARLPMTKETVSDVAGRYGIDLSGLHIRIRKDVTGYSGEALSDGSIVLTRMAFSSESDLAQTLFEERFHVAQIARGGYPPKTVGTEAYETEAEAAVTEWWTKHPLNRENT